MSFIELKDGQLINTALVVSYKNYHNGSAKFEMTTSECILGEPVSDDWENAFCPVVPAAPGYYELYSTMKPGEDRLWSRRAIVAWQITPTKTIPLIEGDKTPGHYGGMQYPNGTCTDIDGNPYNGFNALKREQARLDAAFARVLEPVQQVFSTPFKIAKTHLLDPDGEKILMFEAHALEGGWALPFGIILESRDYNKQENGQAELAALASAVGITEITDEKQFIGKFAVIHSEKTGKERFSVYNEAAQAA